MIAALHCVPVDSVIVLEPTRRGRELRHLVRAVRATLVDRRTTLVLVLDGNRWWAPRGAVDRWVAADDLAMADCRDAAGELGGTIDLDRLLRLTGRRLALAHDALAMARLGACDLVERALSEARNRRHLLDLLTAGLLDERTSSQRDAIEVCLSFGYWHPQLGVPLVAAQDLRPWVVPLEGGWGMLRQLWAEPLARHILTARPGQRHSAPATITVTASTPACIVASPISGRTVQIEAHTLDARLFGSLEVRVDGVPVPRWRGRRGVSILRMLLFRRRHSCTREELLAEFWPDVAPDTARNRLQVAISALRRDLAEITTANVIEYTDHSYTIASNIRVNTDVERFEELLARAKTAARGRDQEQARSAYLDGVALYRADFAVDAPYEQWTLLPRESLRLRYIDALDRISHLQRHAGLLTDCIGTAQRMLETDPCREDAHRLIMHCQASLGHTYQALQQYESCRRVLRAALDAVPSPETVALYERIRDGRPPELPAPER